MPYVGLEAAAWPIPGPCADPIFLAHIRHDLHVDLAEPFVRIRLGVISNGVAVPEVLANALERLHLLLPCFGEENFAARTARDAPENVAGYRVFVYIAGGDHVD